MTWTAMEGNVLDFCSLSGQDSLDGTVTHAEKALEGCYPQCTSKVTLCGERKTAFLQFLVGICLSGMLAEL